MEDLNYWVATAAGYITLIQFLVKAICQWLPKISKSLKRKRRRRRKP